MRYILNYTIRKRIVDVLHFHNIKWVQDKFGSCPKSKIINGGRYSVRMLYQRLKYSDVIM